MNMPGLYEGVFKTAWWLEATAKVTVEGSLEARCEDKHYFYRQRLIQWVWFDNIDAASFMDILKVYVVSEMRHSATPGTPFTSGPGRWPSLPLSTSSVKPHGFRCFRSRFHRSQRALLSAIVLALSSFRLASFSSAPP